MYNFHWFNVWQKSTYGKAIILQLNKQLINFFKTRVRSKIYPHVYCSKLNVRWWLRARASLPYWTQVSNGEMQWTFPLDCKESKPVNRKGNQSWIFIGRTDAEAEPSILWPTDAILFIGEDPDAGKVWRQDEKGTTEDEMVRWHHWLDGREIEQALGVGDGQGSPVCFSPWGHKESDTTEWLNWTDWHMKGTWRNLKRIMLSEKSQTRRLYTCWIHL